MEQGQETEMNATSTKREKKRKSGWRLGKERARARARE
jgi:hypothetical protein